jgi:hypothetical protein
MCATVSWPSMVLWCRLGEKVSIPISVSAGCAGAVKAPPVSSAAPVGGHRFATTRSCSAAGHDVLWLRVGNVNWKTAPCGTLLETHNRPPCASMIARQIDRPTPTPLGFVV